MASAALLSVTLVPAMMVLFVRGRIISENRNPLSRLLISIYQPVIRGVLRAKTLTVLLALAAPESSGQRLGRPTLGKAHDWQPAADVVAFAAGQYDDLQIFRGLAKN
jgi:hypothetical protein